MKYPENSATAAEYLKKAIPHMVDKQLPANPINYTLWYNYVANNIPLLNLALENIVNQEGSVSPEQSQELFLHYIVGEHMEEHNQTLESITQVATHILSRLGESLKGSENFDQQLGNNIGQLEQAGSLDEVTAIIDQVISTTEGIRSANSEFQQNMQQANDEIGSLRAKLESAEKQAYIDQLTQINNRHAFDRKLIELLQAESGSENVCLILLDLDHFKSFNDNYGHVIGDRVLQRLGEIIREHCTGNAFGARYGGEEFAVIISDGSIESASAIAENLRQQLEQVRVKLKNSDKILNNISASFGIANYAANEPIEMFIDRADKALYRAKNNGRNRVEIYSEELAEA